MGGKTKATESRVESREDESWDPTAERQKNMEIRKSETEHRGRSGDFFLFS
jgi:hypothetical protein